MSAREQHRCSYPGCPNASFKSPWEREEAVDYMAPGRPPHYCSRLHVPRRSLDFQYAAEDAAYREPSSHHVLALQTAPRPADMLGKTFASLYSAGAGDFRGVKILGFDGPLKDLELVPPGWEVFVGERVGSARAFVRILRWALTVDPDLDYLTFVEDDVELCRNALAYVARLRMPEDVAFVTWFTYDYDYSSPRHVVLGEHPASLGRPILACRSARYFILTQCCTFSRYTVERVLSCPMAAERWPKRDAHDELISWALGDSLYAAHFPILVQHAGGLNSAVSLDRAREFEISRGLADGPKDPQSGARSNPYYVGPDFDVLSLLPGKTL